MLERRAISLSMHPHEKKSQKVIVCLSQTIVGYPLIHSESVVIKWLIAFGKSYATEKIFTIMEEHLCSECLGVVDPSWRHCAHCSSLLAIELTSEKPRTTGPRGPPPPRITETTPENTEELNFEKSSSDETITGFNLEEGNSRVWPKRLGLALVPILVVGIAFLLLSSTIISPGTISLLDEYRDTDEDGFKDSSDIFPLDSTEWADNDLDGIGDNGDRDDDNDGFDDIQETLYCNENTDPLDSEDFPLDTDSDGKCNWIDYDDDGDGWSDISEDNCGTNSLDSSSLPSDTDSDGLCNIEDIDDDDDGFEDDNDAFPFDSSEWNDNDADGIGDNADLDDDNDGYSDAYEQLCGSDPLSSYTADQPLDTDLDGQCDLLDSDDDNDGVLDIYDVNDFLDTGLVLTFDTIRINEQMDYFDSLGEIYICFHWNYDYLSSWAPMDYIHSCTPDTGYWSLEDYTTYDISSFSIYIDLPEQQPLHTFGMSVWDADSWEDDPIDINPSSDFNFFYFNFDSTTQSMTPISFLGDGAGDGQGWNGVLSFSIQPIDVQTTSSRYYTWEYDGQSWEYETTLSYTTYVEFRDLDHSVRGIDYIEDYARFSTPNEQYVIDLANDLKNMAIQNGYTTDLEIAEFIYAFVGAIEYQFDIEAMGENEYPKYPIEMLWHQAGDCEDEATLYISLVESIGFDAMLMVGLVKQNSEEDWGGHAWAVIYIPDHSGDGWYGIGSKSSTPFYFVEATGYYDGYSYIGDNPWYDVTDYSMYDVE